MTNEWLVVSTFVVPYCQLPCGFLLPILKWINNVVALPK